MYKRILVKLSGEGLSNKSKNLLIDNDEVLKIVHQLKVLNSQGVEIAIVIGGGNFWRGASAASQGISRVRADYIGMLATIMNALALQSSFESIGLKSRVQSSVNIDPKVAEYYVTEKAIHYLAEKEIIIFAGGTGRPFFTTDTAAALVASELKCEAILMGKNGVDGVYDSDPKFNPQAKFFEHLTYDEVIIKELKVMDSTSAAMAKDNDIKTIVFNIKEEDAIIKVLTNKLKHTTIGVK